MTKRTALSPLACTAIAAVLAIAPTTAFAQETTAQTALPDPVPAANPAPAPIIIPEMRAAPVVQAVPEVSAAPEPAAQPRVQTALAARAAPRQTGRPVAAAPVAVQPVSAAQIADPAPVAAPAAVTPVAAIAAAPQSAAVPADENTTALGLGLLGLVALGGAGAYAAARRRRRVAEPEVLYSDERLAAAAPTFAEPIPVRTTAAPASAPAVATSAAAPLMFERKPLAPTTAGSAIPPRPLPTGPALAELFERMARAAPDADNPFKGDKRRRARVRWLMKQHEYRLRDAARQNAEDRFDFRTFAASTKQAEPERTRTEVVPA